LSTVDFERARVLSELGLEHGFGTRASFAATPDDRSGKQVHGSTLLRTPPAGVEREATRSGRTGRRPRSASSPPTACRS
jgi:hypothetical protein